ncbi:MAG: discoidin domain-containing protein [Cyclobacteriaceae bacterium]
MNRSVLLIALFLAVGSVFGQNQAPQAKAGSDTVIMGTLPMVHALDASASYDTDDNLTNYYWVLEDDTISFEKQYQVTLTEKASKFKLIVEDELGKTDIDYLSIFVGHPTNHGLNRIPFRNGSFPLFASGMNIAWRNFARDLDEFTEDDELFYRQLMDSIKANGGNALRWWLHTNGSNSPIVNADGMVTGIEFDNILAMKRVLDIAFEKGIVFSMCLWSFDMLQTGQGQDTDAMLNLMEDSANIQSYIDNALNPILDKLAIHPAVFTWEIFNEPEGMSRQFGWTSAGKTDMSNIQRFVNMTAGAIHRHTPSALVSNGSWSFRASTDIEGNTNYYADDALIAQGGDQDGTLDFYQVHYYSEHAGNEFSPFHRPASHWGLDKPIVIGEFPADTLDRKADPDYATAQAYELAVKYGYAGVMSWAWTDNQFNDAFAHRTGKGLRVVQSLIPESVDIDNSTIQLSEMPIVAAQIAPVKVMIEDTEKEFEVDLSSVFQDKEDGTNLTYSFIKNSNTELVEVIPREQLMSLTVKDQVGYSILDFEAKDAEGWPVVAQGLVMVGSTALQGNNLAYFGDIASSNNAVGHPAELVTDADLNSTWESKQSGNQWLQLDLHQNTALNFIGLQWKNDFADQYLIEMSSDGLTWEQVQQVTEGDGEKDVFVMTDPIQPKYLRLQMMHDKYVGYELREWTVMNIPDNQAPAVISEIDNYEAGWSMTEDVNLYIRFEDVFSDESGVEYLTYEVRNTNESVVNAYIPITNKGVGLDFKRSSIPGAATITIEATDPFGAKADASFEVVIDNDLLKVAEKQNDHVVYPNPVKNILTIEGPNIDQLRLYDLQGQLLIETNNSNQMDLERINPGFYLLKLKYQNRFHAIKIIKE